MYSVHYAGGNNTAAAAFVVALRRGERSERHSGHVVCKCSHTSMHRAWYRCLQAGSRLTVSPLWTSSRHTEHTGALSAGSPPLPAGRSYPDAGSASIAASVSPHSAPAGMAAARSVPARPPLPPALLLGAKKHQPTPTSAAAMAAKAHAFQMMTEAARTQNRRIDAPQAPSKTP